jgi:hypothetical protein
MARSRRNLRAHAFVRAALALGGGSGAFLSVPLLPLAVIAQQAPDKKESKPVAINILVIEGDEKQGSFDPRLERLKKSMPGYTGAKLLDELRTNVEEGSSVSLEIMKQSGQSRLLRVTVQNVEPNGTVRLQVAIDALKLKTDTTHEKGATFMVRHPMPGNKALFLAVTPKL